jgi:ubiquinone/menaquinone biosynthesis C-methylase UbiE
VNRLRWDRDPLWATLYDWSVEHPGPGGAAWRAVVGSDLRLLYEAADEIGRLPVGARVLDIPCGGGVALRGLRVGQGVDYVAADIAPAMLDRTARAALDRGVADQVRPRLADVGALPFEDASFDLVVSFTGLHCFPSPYDAVAELARVTRPGGAITGSAIFNDTGRRFAHLRLGGRLSGLVGPCCTTRELSAWLQDAGFPSVRLQRSGAIAYFRAVRA